VDECHGGLYHGLVIGGLGMFGLLIIAVGIALLSQADENDSEEVNRELRKLRNQPTTRGRQRHGGR
jgi:cadmium resistance protein CadD (predicted permease)